MRRRADVTEILRVAAEFQFRRTTIGAIRRDSDGGQIVFSIRQRETKTEGAIRAQFDFMTAQRDFRIRLRRAINDQLRINIEPKALGFFRRAKRTRRAGNAKRRVRGAGRRHIVRQTAANEFGDFERAHPDPACLINFDDAGQSFFLLGRPLFGEDRSFDR